LLVLLRDEPVPAIPISIPKITHPKPPLTAGHSKGIL
jgi:hypothetical protein